MNVVGVCMSKAINRPFFSIDTCTCSYEAFICFTVIYRVFTNERKALQWLLLDLTKVSSSNDLIALSW